MSQKCRGTLSLFYDTSWCDKQYFKQDENEREVAENH